MFGKPPEQNDNRQNYDSEEWYPSVCVVVLIIGIILAVIINFSLKTALFGNRGQVGAGLPGTAAPPPPVETVVPRPAAAGWLQENTIGCDSFFQAEEYWQSVHHNDARQQQYLFTHGCVRLRSLEYSVVDDRGLYPVVRVYLEDGRSRTFWLIAPLP